MALPLTAAAAAAAGLQIADTNRQTQARRDAASKQHAAEVEALVDNLEPPASAEDLDALLDGLDL